MDRRQLTGYHVSSEAPTCPRAGGRAPGRAPWPPRASAQARKRRGPGGVTRGRGLVATCLRFTLSAQSSVSQAMGCQHLPSNLFCVNLGPGISGTVCGGPRPGLVLSPSRGGRAVAGVPGPQTRQAQHVTRVSASPGPGLMPTDHRPGGLQTCWKPPWRGCHLMAMCVSQRARLGGVLS